MSGGLSTAAPAQYMLSKRLNGESIVAIGALKLIQRKGRFGFEKATLNVNFNYFQKCNLFKGIFLVKLCFYNIFIEH